MRGKARQFVGQGPLLVALALVVAACGRSGPALLPIEATTASKSETPARSLTEVTPFYIPGEKMTWKVRFLAFEVGRARFAVGNESRAEDGRLQVELLAEGQASGVSTALLRARDVIHTWVDVDSGIPTRTESAFELFIKVRDVKKRIDVIATRNSNQTQVDLAIWKPGVGDYKRRQRLPSPETLDPLSTLSHLRGWSAQTGQRRTVYTLGGTRIWQTYLVVQGHEIIETRLGRRSTIRLDGISRRLVHNSRRVDPNREPRTFSMWISEDRQRVPLRIVATTEYGKVSLELTSYTAPLTARR